MSCNRLRELRLRHGLNQAELAAQLGVSQGTLSNWEQGKHDIDNGALVALARLFHVTIDQLLCADTEGARPAAPAHPKSFRDILDEDPATQGVATVAAHDNEISAFSEAEKKELQQIIKETLLQLQQEQSNKK